LTRDIWGGMFLPQQSTEEIIMQLTQFEDIVKRDILENHDGATYRDISGLGERMNTEEGKIEYFVDLYWDKEKAIHFEEEMPLQFVDGDTASKLIDADISRYRVYEIHYELQERGYYGVIVSTFDETKQEYVPSDITEKYRG